MTRILAEADLTSSCHGHVHLFTPRRYGPLPPPFGQFSGIYLDLSNMSQLMSTHGITLEVKNGDSHPKPHTRLLPILVLSKTTLHADIPITPVGKDGRRDDVGPDPAWSKKSDMLYWVGRNR
jgi:beta-1,2-xylosyltransferase